MLTLDSAQKGSANGKALAVGICRTPQSAQICSTQLPFHLRFQLGTTYKYNAESVALNCGSGVVPVDCEQKHGS